MIASVRTLGPAPRRTSVTAPDHAVYAKRRMAEDCRGLMQHLGICAFRCGRARSRLIRLATDHPEVAERLVIMEAIPIGESLARGNATFAAAWRHWFFLGQTVKPAECVILMDPETWYALDRDAMGEENYRDVLRAIRNPATVHAMCEDYRAGLGPDRAADDADTQAGHRLECSVLFMRTGRYHQRLSR